MPRIAGVDIPGEKRIVVSLTYIFGISKNLSQKALKAIGIDESIRAKDVSEDERDVSVSAVLALFFFG